MPQNEVAWEGRVGFRPVEGDVLAGVARGVDAHETPLVRFNSVAGRHGASGSHPPAPYLGTECLGHLLRCTGMIGMAVGHEHPYVLGLGDRM